MKSRTLKDQFDTYLKACYGDKIPDVQKREVHQAFFTGAFIMGKMLAEASNAATEPEAMGATGKLLQESIDECKNTVFAQQNRS